MFLEPNMQKSSSKPAINLQKQQTILAGNCLKDDLDK
jgi:hypothetical protein